MPESKRKYSTTPALTALTARDQLLVLRSPLDEPDPAKRNARISQANFLAGLPEGDGTGTSYTDAQAANAATAAGVGDVKPWAAGPQRLGQLSYSAGRTYRAKVAIINSQTPPENNPANYELVGPQDLTKYLNLENGNTPANPLQGLFVIAPEVRTRYQSFGDAEYWMYNDGEQFIIYRADGIQQAGLYLSAAGLKLYGAPGFQITINNEPLQVGDGSIKYDPLDSEDFLVSVVGGTYPTSGDYSGEMQEAAPAGSIPGMSFKRGPYKYEYGRGHSGLLTWLRIPCM